MIIDLSLPLYTGMPVYPGDKEAVIERVSELERDGWNMQRLEINSHDGTHVNVPFHSQAGGKTLDDYSLEHFCGLAEVYNPSNPISSGKGLIFRDHNIDAVIAEKIKKIRPPFIGLSAKYEFDIVIEKDLLAAEIISFERLINLEKLPDSFMFYGMPLNLRGGDGSPVRAFAIV